MVPGRIEGEPISNEEMLTAQEILVALDAVRTRVERERRAQFATFGVPEDCLWPASRVFHQHSSLNAAWQPGLSVAEVETLTYQLAYKSYAGSDVTSLPSPAELKTTLVDALRLRRSIRDFVDTEVRLSALATMLGLGCGVTEWSEVPRRAAPSGGALFPIETYVVALRIEALTPAIYHYVPLRHVLEHVRPLVGIEALASSLPPGLLNGNPPVVLVLSAVFAQIQRKYLERGYRFALLEAGHIAQNIALLATGMGLGTVCVGGFWDDPLNDLLSLEPSQEAAVYAVLVGWPR
jgi:SagB-type dehydrogenase family enzyme